MRLFFVILLSVLFVPPSFAKNSLFEKGLDAFEQKNYSEAIGFYTKHLKRYDNANVYFNRALAYYHLQDYAAAIEDFTLVLNKDPIDYEAWYNRSLAYFAMGNTEKALLDSKEALALKPDYVEAIVSIALCYSAQEKEKKAIAFLSSAIDTFESAKLYFNRALIFEKTKDYVAAEKDFNEAILLIENTRYYDSRAKLFLKQKKYDLAIKDYSKALDVDSSNSNIWYNRALVFYASYKENDAITDFKKCLLLDSTFIDAKWQLSLCYYSQSKYEEALKMYLQVEQQNASYSLLNNEYKQELLKKIKLKHNLVYIVSVILLSLLSLFFLYNLWYKKTRT